MDQFFSPEPLSVNALVLNMLLGLGLSVLLSLFYARYGEAMSNRYKFARLLPLLSMTTTLVISIIKASLALSLGLVGALSIVRFRTAIKDPEELLYLFLAIAIGLGFGADQRIPTLVAVGIIMVLLVVRRFVVPRTRRRNLYLNVKAASGDAETSVFKVVNDVLSQHARYVDMRRLDHHDGLLQMTYLMDCADQDTLVALMADLQSAVPGCSFTFIDQNSMPEL